MYKGKLTVANAITKGEFWLLFRHWQEWVLFSRIIDSLVELLRIWNVANSNPDTLLSGKYTVDLNALAWEGNVNNFIKNCICLLNVEKSPLRCILLTTVAVQFHLYFLMLLCGCCRSWNYLYDLCYCLNVVLSKHAACPSHVTQLWDATWSKVIVDIKTLRCRFLML